MAPAAPTVYTVGHSNGSIEDFLALLGSHAVQVVVDVRSSPTSRYTPHFGGNQLKRHLATAGIRYLFLGRELGGRPDGEEFYDPDGRVRYDRLAATPIFRAAIERLTRGASDHRIAIMCGEEDPVSCHRRRLVGKALLERDVTVAHIRHSGAIESEHETAIREAVEHPKLMQLTWDGDLSWRSIHPVRERTGLARSS